MITAAVAIDVVGEDEQKFVRVVASEMAGLRFTFRWGKKLEVKSSDWTQQFTLDENRRLIVDSNSFRIGRFRYIGNLEQTDWIIVEDWNRFLDALRRYDSLE